MRPQKEIDAEISALKACKSYAPKTTVFGEDNHHNIDLQIEYLRGKIDTTADEEWEEFNEREQDAILEVQNWEDGDSDESPSSGWDSYKEKFTKKKK